VLYGALTTGAESDIEQLTQIARQMVGQWGMSEKIGPISVLLGDSSVSLLPGSSEVSPRTLSLVDLEVQRLIEAVHVHVAQLLSSHRDQLARLARALLKFETLDATDAYAAALVQRDHDDHSAYSAT
jgi:cell division protease FtsH